MLARLVNRFRGQADGADALGARGERLAARILRDKGYRILERNLKCGDDEADLIAQDPDGHTVVIVEVKTREASFPSPEDQIDRHKQFRLAKIAARLQKQARYRDRPFRFDAVTIIWPAGGEPQARHYEAAFDSPF